MKKPQAKEGKRDFVSQSVFPQISLRAATRIAQALWDNFAGKNAEPHEIAIAIDLSPTSGGWRNLCGSSIAYGLTEGGYNASQISLTDLGRRIVAPTDEGDDVKARAEAMMRPTLLREFYSKYDKAKFPKDEIVKNVLVTMGLPKDRTSKALEIVKENGNFSGVLRNTKTGLFVAIGTPTAWSAAGFATDVEQQDPEAIKADGPEDPIEPSTDSEKDEHTSGRGGAKNLFIAHGKNHKPLEDLKKILNQFKISFKVAIDEPNKGRPISGKVASLMHECSAGIFIFTKDESFFKKKGGRDRDLAA